MSLLTLGISALHGKTNAVTVYTITAYFDITTHETVCSIEGTEVTVYSTYPTIQDAYDNNALIYTTSGFVTPADTGYYSDTNGGSGTFVYEFRKTPPGWITSFQCA